MASPGAAVGRVIDSPAGGGKPDRPLIGKSPGWTV
jgi:hypothetical protein